MKNGMEKAIKDFAKQFSFKPVIKNVGALPRGRNNKGKYLLIGMGGSHLSADVLKCLRPGHHLVIHSDYGLPPMSAAHLKEHLVILSSYSGNTEEEIDAFHAGRRAKLNMAVIAAGGALLELAKEHGVPYIVLPETGIQPRMALGFGMLSILALMGRGREIKALGKLSAKLHPGLHEKAGREIAKALRGSVPVFYSSARNEAVAKNWKIKFNETGKVPAFYNILPEMDHNEMTGFSAGGGPASGGDAVSKSRQLSKNFRIVLLRDSSDHPRVKKRFDIMEKILKKRGLSVLRSDFGGKTREERVFGSLLTADWAAYHTALGYGAEPEQVPMVEEFKKMMK